jgi:DNA polymerase
MRPFRIAGAALQPTSAPRCKHSTPDQVFARKELMLVAAALTGDASADLVFVGEAPGEAEDRQGEPFAGPSGQLLTRIIEAMGLCREQVYILNIVKCRPPKNRDPHPDELAACRPILQAQLDCLQPRVICTLGKFASQALLQTDEAISRLRGRFHTLGEIPVMPTYHPAYLLRNPHEKRVVWQDMQAIQKILNLH